MNTLFESLPAAIILWLIVYAADYYLTIYGQRLWLAHAKDNVVFSGSYELNPYYQQDIDGGRLLSKRFIFMLAYGIVWMLVMWGATRYLSIPQVFPASVGFLLLVEVVVLSSHVQNIRLFKAAALPNAVQGQIAYSRWVSFDGTAWKFGYWGLIFLVLAVMMGNWFFAGGALACLYYFLRYWRYGLRMRQLPESTAG
ncbi:MAG: hypothetical protein GC179_09475 [Anaerolineaceae bacterium]|nr:hypothetical protein [Anaerolineaceae bacterium]